MQRAGEEKIHLRRIQDLAIVQDAQIPRMQSGQQSRMGRDREGNGSGSCREASEVPGASLQAGIGRAWISVAPQVISPEGIDGQQENRRGRCFLTTSHSRGSHPEDSSQAGNQGPADGIEPAPPAGQEDDLGICGSSD